MSDDEVLRYRKQLAQLERDLLNHHACEECHGQRPCPSYDDDYGE